MAAPDFFQEETRECILEKVADATPFLKNSNLELGEPYLISSNQKWEANILNKLGDGSFDYVILTADGDLSETSIHFSELKQPYLVDLSSCF